MVLVKVSVTYLRPGSHNFHSYVINELNAEATGKGPHFYRNGGCEPPPPDLRSVANIYSGQTLTGNICYEIASQDAGTLRMHGGFTIPIPQQDVWFALT